MRHWYITILLICAFGYVVAAALLLQLGGVSREFNFLVRVAETGLLLFVLLFSISHWSWINRGLTPLIIFFVFYGMRLIYDVGVLGIVSEFQSPMYVYGYFFGLTVLPVICIGLLFRPEDGPAFYRQALFLLALGNILLLSYAVTDGSALDGTFSGRAEKAGEEEGTAILNPLAFGMFGAMLAAVLVAEFASGNGLTLLRVVLIGTGLAVAGANILFGASRGPLLAALVAIGLLMLRGGRLEPEAAGRFSRGGMWALVLGLGAVVAAAIAKSDGSTFLFERILMTFEQRMDGTGEARDSIFSVAWADFLSSPLFGSSYVVSQDFASPHNIFLEALLSTGVVGTVFFIAAIARTILGVWRLVGGANGSWGVGLGLITICLLVAGQTSSSIGQTPELWIFAALVTVISTGAEPQRSL